METFQPIIAINVIIDVISVLHGIIISVSLVTHLIILIIIHNVY